MLKSITRGRVMAAAGVVVAAALVGGGTASAANLITSDDVKNGSLRSVDLENDTIKSKDVTDGSLRVKDLTDDAVDTLQKQGPQGATGPQGPKGDTGATGARGPQGPKGDNATYVGEHWGVIARNTIAPATAVLRSGPFSAWAGDVVKPPFGQGSLALTVAGSTDKVAFGNEVDFQGMRVADLSAVGFHVYTTGENSEAPTANMPSIAFEIDPNVGAVNSNYSSLVFTPTSNSAPNKWSDYIDATTEGLWGLSGSAFNGTTCSLNGSRCTWDQMLTYLSDGGDDAMINTAAITKGRDYAFVGAVDGLRINDSVYDFEPFGVYTRTP